MLLREINDVLSLVLIRARSEKGFACSAFAQEERNWGCLFRRWRKEMIRESCLAQVSVLRVHEQDSTAASYGQSLILCPIRIS